jgi:CHAT domain-containing protein
LRSFCAALSGIVLPLILRSGIGLSDGAVLTVAELRRLQLQQLELLILSTCESGITGGQAVDQSMSFPGMMYGTASRAVIATQWAVDAAATGRIFERFYEEWSLSHEPAAIAQALRRAQLGVREEGMEHPLWWGGLALVG